MPTIQPLLCFDSNDCCFLMFCVDLLHMIDVICKKNQKFRKQSSTDWLHVGRKLGQTDVANIQTYCYSCWVKNSVSISVLPDNFVYTLSIIRVAFLFQVSYHLHPIAPTPCWFLIRIKNNNILPLFWKYENTIGFTN